MAGGLLYRSLLKFVPKKGITTLQTLSCRRFFIGNQMRNGKDPPFDRKLLEILVCPLSKKPLRYDDATNELISDEIGVAYSIQNGIPNLIPQDGRLLKKEPSTVNDTDCS